MEKALTGLMSWIDDRLPLTRTWNTHMGEYYAPKNFNLWYFFGVFSLLVLVNQLLTGIWLTMNYTPSAEEAFASVEYIMRDVDYVLLRYMHSTGASAFFVVVLHMMRALLYGSYKKPRELIWIFHADFRCADGRNSWVTFCPGAKCPIGAHRSLFLCSARFPEWVKTSLDSWRLLDLRHHAEPFLRLARGGPAHRIAGAGGAAHSRAP